MISPDNAQRGATLIFIAASVSAICIYHTVVKPRTDHWKPKSRLLQRIRAFFPF